MNLDLDLDLNNSRTLTILIIIVLILFAIVYVWINRDGFDNKEGFINYPVGVGDFVQLQGGLDNVQVGSNNTPLPTSINNLIQQALNTFSAGLSYPRLFGVMNYSVIPQTTCSGVNAIKSMGNIIPNNAQPTNSGLCLFNWSNPGDIFFDQVNKSGMKILSSFAPNVNSYMTTNIFNNNNLDKNKQHLVDLSFSLYSAGESCIFDLYLLTFDNNYNVINKSTINKISSYCINIANAHTSFNVKCIVPADNNMKNWGIYLFNSKVPSSSLVDILVNDRVDTVSIAVYTI